MPTELIQLLTNLPIVAVFVWFVERSNKAFMEYLREERAARQAEQAAERTARQAEIKMLADRIYGLESKLDMTYGRRRDDER